MTLAEKEAHLEAEYTLIPDAQERFQYLLEQSAAATPLAPVRRTEDARVHGCVSAVWVASELIDGRLYFQTAADAPIVSGLAWFLADFFSGAEPAEIVGFEPRVLGRLGLKRALSENRQRGLAALQARFRELAEAALASPRG